MADCLLIPATRSGEPRRSWPLLLAALLTVGTPSAFAQNVRAGGEETITIRGILSGTVFVQDQVFGLGNGHNAIWADLPEFEEDEWFHGGDVRNTRLGLDFRGPDLFGNWRASGTLEVDFFGGFVGSGTFSDEQPQLRLRLAYVDLTNGRTTIRLGQAWSPTFGYVPESLSHIAFPLGWGGGGLIGWRFPGLFLIHELNTEGPTRAQIQFAAMRGSWSDEIGPDVVSAGEATLVPQLEARFGLRRQSGTRGTDWEAFVAGHYDHKDLSGPGIDDDDDLDGWAVTGGFRVRPGRFTLLANGYIGRAIGHLFAQILQFADLEGWGAQGQVGYDLTDNWSLWGFYGIDNPDDDAPLRLRNRIISTMLRYRYGQYSAGLEWYRALTDHRVLIDDERGVNGNQFALSVRYDF